MTTPERESLLGTVPSHARGLSILLVDSDTSSLMRMASLLEQYSFKVTPTNLTSVALPMVNKKKTQFNLVMANLEKADVERVALICPLLINNTPFILFSYEGDENATGRSLADEVTFYCFKKPVALEDLKDIWQHAFGKRTYRKEDSSMMKKSSGRPERSRGNGSASSRKTGISQQLPSTNNSMLKKMENNVSGCKPMQTNPPCEASKIVNPEVCPKESTGKKEMAKKGEALIIREYPDPATFIPERINDNNENRRRAKGLKINDRKVNPEVSSRGSISIGTRDMVKKGKEPLIIQEYPADPLAFRAPKRINIENNGDEGRRGKRPRINHDKADSKDGNANERGASKKTRLIISSGSGSGGGSCSGSKSRPRTVWNTALHRKFVEALTALGDKNARPKKILKMMDVPDLTQRQVGSHLQKYKAQVQRICDNTEIDLTSPSVIRSSIYGGSEASQWMQLYQEQEGFDFTSNADANQHKLSENMSSFEGISSNFNQGGLPLQTTLPGTLSWPYNKYKHDELHGNFRVLAQQTEKGSLNGHRNCSAEDDSLDLPRKENINPFDIPCSNGTILTVFPEVAQIDPPGLTAFLGSELPELETEPFATTSTAVMPYGGEGQLEEFANFGRNTEYQQEMPLWSEAFDSSSAGYLPNQESALNFGTGAPNQSAYPYGTGQLQTTEMDFLTSADLNQLLNPPNDASSKALPELAGNSEGCQLYCFSSEFNFSS